MTAQVSDAGSPEMRAMELWDRLRTLFLATQDTLEKIIYEKAWEPLGYASFAEAWQDKMGDITLASELRPHVVYQLLADGLNVNAIAAAVKGVGPAAVAGLQRQRSNGVPAKHASLTVVSRHLRNKPAPRSTLHLEVGESAYVEYQRIAKKVKMTVEEIALDAIKARFKELV